MKKIKMDKEQKKRLLISLIVIFGTILVIASACLIIEKMGESTGKKNTEKNQKSYAADLPVGTTSPDGVYPVDTDPVPDFQPGTGSDPTAEPATSAPVENKVDFKSLINDNPDAYSWIYIPDTNISLPVMQSAEDDNFYLDHDLNKNYSFPGEIYSQSKNKKDYSDRVTVLYGHNMANGSMFANLHYFINDNFFDSHKYFYIYTPDRRLTYEVISAYEYDDRHILNSYDFTDDAVFTEWLEATKNPHSRYCNVRDDVKLDLNSKLVVLSTCMDSGDNRFIVQGVLVKDEQTK